MKRERHVCGLEVTGNLPGDISGPVGFVPTTENDRKRRCSSCFFRYREEELYISTVKLVGMCRVTSGWHLSE